MEGAPGVGDDGDANGSVDEVIGVAPVFSSLLYALCMVGDACMHAGDRQKKDKTRTGGNNQASASTSTRNTSG